MVGLLMQMTINTFCKGENVKYCKDCKYCKRDLWCVFPDRISIVTGKPQSKFCTVVRNDSQGLCGTEAKWFEQKEIEVKQSLFNKIISWFK